MNDALFQPPDDWPRRRLWNAALPFAYGKVGPGLTVCVKWHADIALYHVSTADAQTMVASIEAVEEIVKGEASGIGWLEEKLTGRNTRKEKLERLEAISRGEFVEVPTSEPDLDDLLGI